MKAVTSAICLFVAIGAWATVATSAKAEARIDWRLENPFRLFKKPEHTRLHYEVFEKLTPEERKAPILAAERNLELRFAGRGWAGLVFNETCYDQDGDRYTACKDYVMPKSHRILATLRPMPGVLDLLGPAVPTGTCTWQVVARNGKVLSQRKSPCRQQAALDIPYPAGARVTVSSDGAAVAEPTDVKVRDVLIVGLGDSFGAGEGNPDHPVTFDDERSFDYGVVDIAASHERLPLDGYPAREGDWKALNDRAFQNTRARWWDRECHRSLYSHQLRAALQLAVENPKRAVTFVSFSCSGAEIVEGLLLRKPVRECTPGESFQVKPQVSALSEELCQSVVRQAPMPQAVINRVPELRNFAEDDMKVSRCLSPEGRPAMKRPIDLLFLSVGGNDVGFTAIVSDSLLSDTSIYRRLGSRLGSVYGPEEARKRLDLLKKRYEGLRFALEVMFGVRSESGGGSSRVILTGYPNMGYATDGASACGGTGGLEVFPPLRLDGAKVGKAEEFTAELNAQLAAVAGRSWTYVSGHQGEFLSHGLCASNGASVTESLSFPRFQNQAWTPFKPSEYLPYIPRQRWFRTPNDAFLTANMHAAAVSNFGANCSSLYTIAMRGLAKRYWTPFQVFLASTYGGAFHPTAEGQAAIADHVAAAARRVLDGTH